jgi:hypothetical protein
MKSYCWLLTNITALATLPPAGGPARRAQRPEFAGLYRPAACASSSTPAVKATACAAPMAPRRYPLLGTATEGPPVRVRP